MKLERLDVWTSNGEECRQYISDGEFIQWSEELEEAWGKQQPMKINKTKGSEWCPRCGANVDEEHQYSNDYCACCGQSLAQDE